ncbi:MAG: DUF5615 family PIN-like protein [bacterium]
MRVLLDENFPIQLHRRLQQDGYECEHLVLGPRGISDEAIRERLMVSEDLVLLTNDKEFADWPRFYRGRVIVSRVPQRITIAVRVEIWFGALVTFLAAPQAGDRFELLESGEILALDVGRTKDREF